MKGKIIKSIAGFYYVEAAESGIYKSRAKGLFRKQGIRPLVGDRVEFIVTHEQDREANIEKIFPRKNELYRPAAANVDLVLIVMAYASPEPDYSVLDRFLIQMERLRIPALICFNKEDIAPPGKVSEAAEIYGSAGYELLSVSVKEKTGLDELKEKLKGKTTVLAGPSGVGKSSMINYLLAEEIAETGEISAKLKRGKNTTRCVQLIKLSENTFVCDTPGFTSFEAEDIAKEELGELFPEIKKHGGGCRFALCAHINEPDCAVKAAVEAGEISSYRYASYTRLFEELRIKEKNRYK